MQMTAILCLFLLPLTARAQQDSSRLEIIVSGYVWGRSMTDPDTPLVISSEDSCKHEGLFSLGDGIGTCLRCGKGIVYDRELFERPLHIVNLQDSGHRKIVYDGNVGFQPSASLDVVTPTPAFRDDWQPIYDPLTAANRLVIMDTVEHWAASHVFESAPEVGLNLQAQQDSIVYRFKFDKEPASVLWTNLLKERNVPSLVSGFEVIDVFAWAKKPNRKQILIDASLHQVAPQIRFVVEGDSLADPDLVEYKRIIGRPPVVTKFQLEKLSNRRYRKFEILANGQKVNRGLHLGRPDAVLSNVKFKPDETKAKDKIEKDKEKVKVKSK